VGPREIELARGIVHRGVTHRQRLLWLVRRHLDSVTDDFVYD